MYVPAEVGHEVFSILGDETMMASLTASATIVMVANLGSHIPLDKCFNKKLLLQLDDKILQSNKSSVKKYSQPSVSALDL